MKKNYILLVAALATLSATAQTYHNNQWYSVYSDETIRMETIAHGDLSGIFAPTAGTMNLNWNYEIWGGGLGSLYKSNTTHIYESATGTVKDTEVGKLTDANKGDYTNSISISQNINYIYFDRPTGNTNIVNITHIDIPLKKHILFDSGNYGTNKAKSNDFGELVWGLASDAFAVNLRSFYTSGDITITCDIPEVFRIGSIDNVNGLTYEVGANACASKNGTANEAGGSKLGKISNYNFQIFFCPQEAKDYSGVVTITDGTSTLMVNVSGKGLPQDQTISWVIDDEYETTAVVPVASASSKLQVAYVFDKEGIISYDAEKNAFIVIKDGTVKITAKQGGNTNYNPADDVEATITISKVEPYITTEPIASEITYPEALSESKIFGWAMESDVQGDFAWVDDATQILDPGEHDLEVIFTPENTNWYTTTTTFVTVNVLQTPQEINWEPELGILTTASIPTATATSGLDVTYDISDEDIVEFAGGEFVIKSFGEVTITVSQDGDTYFAPAADVVKNFVIERVEPVVSGLTASEILSGSKLEASVLAGGEVEGGIAGEFAWKDAEQVLATGEHDDVVAVFTPENENLYAPVEIDVTVKVVASYGELTVAVCPGSKYTYVDEMEYAEGTHEVTIENYLGGDSIVTLTVNALPTYELTDEATICANELPYQWETVTFDQAGTETLTLQTVNGCDSIVTFTLHVLPTINNKIEASICEGDEYDWNGDIYTNSTELSMTFTAANGCDSIVTFVLDVRPVSPVTELEEATIIAGQSVMWLEQEIVLEEAGDTTFVDSLTNINGCDSVILFKVHVQEYVAPVDPTKLENNEVEVQAEKVFRDGHIYILRGKELFDVVGRKQD